MKLKNIVLTSLLGTVLFMSNTSYAVHPKLAFAQSIGFDKFVVEEEYAKNTDTVLTAIDFATKEEADRIKGLKLKMVENGADICIGAVITNFSVDEHWHPPYASARTYTDKYVKKDWYDESNNKHTMTISAVKSEISEHYGRFTFDAYASVNFYVRDVKTGELLFMYTGSDRNDKPMDAYYNILKKFYKKFEKEVKDSRKKFK